MSCHIYPNESSPSPKNISEIYLHNHFTNSAGHNRILNPIEDNYFFLEQTTAIWTWLWCANTVSVFLCFADRASWYGSG